MTNQVLATGSTINLQLSLVRLMNGHYNALLHRISDLKVNVNAVIVKEINED